jgi:hypothetical protein
MSTSTTKIDLIALAVQWVGHLPLFSTCRPLEHWYYIIHIGTSLLRTPSGLTAVVLILRDVSSITCLK